MERSGEGRCGPKVSVIIPAFNVERYVATAVRSVLAQTYRDVEVIVVDDGSTDRTRDELEQFRDRVVVVTQVNGGIGAARNRGIRESTGDVIALLDADDAWLPERVSRCVGFLRERPDVGFVTTDALIIDEQGSPSGGTYLDLVDFPVEGYEERIVRENFVFVGAFVRRAVLDDAGPFDETKPTGVEDYEMWLRLIASGVVPGIVRDPLALYRVRSDSVTRRDDQLVRARNLALRRHLPAYWQRGVYGPSGQAFSIAWDLFRRGEWREGHRFVAAGMHDPDRTRRQLVGETARKTVRRIVSR